MNSYRIRIFARIVAPLLSLVPRAVAACRYLFKVYVPELAPIAQFRAWLLDAKRLHNLMLERAAQRYTEFRQLMRPLQIE